MTAVTPKADSAPSQERIYSLQSFSRSYRRKMTRIEIDEELRSLLREIQLERKSATECAENESDDLIQSENYRGGYDATEMEFCFSLFRNHKEYWFQFSLSDIDTLLRRSDAKIEVRPADS